MLNRLFRFSMERDHQLILLLAILLFVPFLGAVHLFDWDEINFAECAREMIRSGDWFRPQIDYEPFWEKPPLFLWFQAISMQIFGENEFAARLPNAVCGMATLLLVYQIGRRLHDRMFGWLWVLAWIGSILPHLYFHSGIIDPWFNLFIFIGIYGFIEFRWQFFMVKGTPSFWVRYRHLLLGGLAIGMAVLTKGPTAYVIAGLVLILYWARYRFKGKNYFWHLVLFFMAAAIAPLAWFGMEYLKDGPWFIHEFILYQIRLFSTPDSGHGGFFGYHFVVLLLGCFPVSVFAIANLWGDKTCQDEMLESDTLDSCKRSDFGTWMQIMFWVVLILFSIVQTKIVHYSSLAYFPLTYLGAVTIWRAIHWQVFPRISTFLLPTLGIILGGAVAAIPWLGQHLDLLRPLLSRDPFALANLDAQVSWSYLQGIPGLILLAGSIAGLYYWRKKQAFAAAQIVLSSGTMFMALTLIAIVPNIEGYSQRAAIEFYEGKCGEDCFIRPIGFKSYAHLYYACKRPLIGDIKQDDYENLAFGNPGKKVYFVAKITNLGDLPNLPGCHELYRKNGFAFFERGMIGK
jgi:4-amino-4-deoxy-L-arabinose transferase-like glycosyltransferase